MAISDAMRYRLNTGGSAEDLYATIRNFLATSPDAATTQAQMRQYGISGEDVANATGGTSGGLLSGNILAGASWNSLNPTLAGQLTEATGQATSNYAVGGATTADTLTQLNTYLAGGGQFDPKATVFLQTGGVDFIQGVDKGTIKDNINQIVKTLGDQGVNVVLTGSPYAASIDDVVSNNFDPKVDPLFTEIAKENKNVALVGTQGEILQNKKLLVDALHTNAEGTSIYNQSVIDSLSQFKNEVPLNTPQDIVQVQKTNTVVAPPPVITQAAANPVVAQSLARVIPTARGTVIEGDNIEAQIAGVPQSVYETRVDPNNTANWQTVNPKTGEVIDSGTFAGGGDQGLLAASRPVLALAASVLGAPYLSQLIGGATGLTGSALAGATGATIAGGSTALTGGSAEDTLRAALLGGGGGYLGNELNNYLDVGTTDIGITERQFAIQDAKQLADQGLNAAQIRDTLISGGYNDAIIDRALNAITTTPTAVSTPVTDANAVNITAPSNVSLNNVLSTIAPTAPALTVTGDRQVDQQTVNAVNNTLIANAPETVKITGDKKLTADQVVNLLATTPTDIPRTTITTQRPSSITDAVTAATIPLIQPTTPLEVPKVTAEKQKETDPIKLAQLALSAAGLLTAGKALSNTGTPTGFDIVPVPADWRSPPPTEVAPFTPLTPIDFGTRNLLKGTQWEKFLDPNYGKVPAPRQFAQPSNMSYNDLMGILDNKQGNRASNLTINDIISGIQNQYSQPVGGMVDNTVSRSLGGNLANAITGANIGATTGATIGATNARTTSIPNSVFNQMVSTTTGATNAGMLQKVYDPRTGRSFNSPAQAAQYGVTDYVTSLPSNIPLPASTQQAVNAYMAANRGSTVQQALDAIASPYKMTGEQLRDYDIQGTIRSADQQKVRDVVASQSGGLPIDQLVSKLQAFKTNPPTTAQGLAEQGALYSDYANRYANTDYSYSNVGGRPQDVSLKPAEYLPTTFTGYSQPINQYLSSTNQMTPTFTMMQDILGKKPDINQAFQTVLAANPNAFQGNNSLTEATIRNLSSDIDQFGSSTALKNFYQQQQNLLGLGSGFQNQNVSNPQYAALQKQIMDLTERVSDPLFSTMAGTGVGKNEIGNIWRDPVSGLGIGTGQSGAMYFDRDGRPLGRSSIGDIGKTSAEYGINLTGFTPPTTL